MYSENSTRHRITWHINIFFLFSTVNICQIAVKGWENTVSLLREKETKVFGSLLSSMLCAANICIFVTFVNLLSANSEISAGFYVNEADDLLRGRNICTKNPVCSCFYLKYKSHQDNKQVCSSCKNKICFMKKMEFRKKVKEHQWQDVRFKEEKD